MLFRAGESADAGYVIMQGAVKLTRKGPRKSVPEITLGPGVLLGELALLTETARPDDATATEPTTVIRIPRSLFRRVLEGFPEAARLMRDRFGPAHQSDHRGNHRTARRRSTRRAINNRSAQ